MNRTPIPGMNKDSYWVGLSRNKDGGMEWTDGSVVVSNSSVYLITFHFEFSRPMPTGHQENHQKHGMEKLKIVQEFTAVANGMTIPVVINFLLFAEFPVPW